MKKKLSVKFLISIVSIFFLILFVFFLDYSDFHILYAFNAIEDQEFSDEVIYAFEGDISQEISSYYTINEVTGDLVAVESKKSNANKSQYRIFINLDNKKLYLYKNEVIEKVYPVSGGKSSTPTPLGKWVIVQKSTWGEGFGGAWMGFNVPWGKYGIHGTVEPWDTGKHNSSKGCIRMKNEDVRELYKIVPYGTVVEIVYENQPFRIMKSGDVGSDILELQKQLKEINYFPYYCDGKFGDNTVRAVKKFQKEHKLVVTGKVDKATLSAIKRAIDDSLE